MRYNNDFKIVSQTINDKDSISFNYDRDGLLKQIGALKCTPFIGPLLMKNKVFSLVS